MAQILYQFCKVRGFKTVLQWFPSAVANIKPVLKFTRELLAESEGISDTVDFYESQHMYVRYIMILWTSFVLQVPFDLDRVLNTAEDREILLLTLSILEQKYLSTNGKLMEASAYCLAVYYGRPDRQHGALAAFLAKIEGQFSIGALRFLVQLSKLSDRSVLLEHRGQIEAMLRLTGDGENTSVQQKLLIKLRTFLFISEANERRAINNGLVKEVLDILGSNRLTNLRWTAAKCLCLMAAIVDAESRISITHFLLDLVQMEMRKDRGEIVGSLTASPATLHGGFLALGRLISHNCYRVSETRSHDLLECLIFGLRFDQVKGSYSVGSNVRDAACYACWSWSRNHRTEDGVIITDDRLSAALVCMALFDRDVAGRRAAAAALQELIGRLGKHTHVPLLEHVNFFTLSSIEHSFEQSFPAVLKLGLIAEEAFFAHLSRVTLFNFDKKMRCLAADACGRLRWNDSYWRQLLAQYKREADDLYAGHGTLVALARLHAMKQDQELTRALIDVSISGINTLSPKFLGFELALDGYLELIGALSQCSSDANVIACWLKYLQLGLKINKSDDSLRGRAMDCLMSLPHVDAKFYMAALAGIELDRDPNVQKGHIATVAAVPEHVFQSQKPIILKTLLKVARQTAPINDIERRLWALKAISILLKRQSSIDTDDRQSILTALIEGPLLLDYSTDQRGDVGSKIRLAALDLFCELNVPICGAIREILYEQLFGRLDRLRNKAGEILQISPVSEDLFAIGAELNLASEAEGLGLLRGLVYTCGGLNAALAESSLKVLLLVLRENKRIFDQFQSYSLQFIDTDIRLQQPLILTMLKLDGHVSFASSYYHQLTDKIIQQLIPSSMSNIRKLLPIFQLLIQLANVHEASAYLSSVKDTFKYPVICQLIRDSNKI